MSTVLAAQDLTVGFRVGRRARRIVLEQLSVAVAPGEFVCLLGPNGAGKSSLLRTLAGLQPPLGGTVLLGGSNLRELPRGEVARRVAAVLTEQQDTGRLTGRDLVGLGRHPHTGWFGRLDDDDRGIVTAALDTVSAAHLADRVVAELSDGERQRVMIARALAQQPTIIILDEPAAFLDVTARVELVALLRRLAREQHLAIVLATHDLELGLVVAGDRVGRDLDTIGHAPGGPEQPGDGAGWGWRGLCNRGVARAATRHAHDQAPPDPPVPPQPVHEHPIARARRRGHVQVKALPRGDAGLRSITSDHRPRAGWDLPARVARARILSLHRIGGSSGSRGHRGGCAATARSTARAEDERHDRGADGEESRVWHDVSRSGRSWTSQHLRKRTRHRASTFPTSGSAAGLSGCSRAARELVAPRLGT